jgi:hypothetical protein
MQTGGIAVRRDSFFRLVFFFLQVTFSAHGADTATNAGF